MASVCSRWSQVFNKKLGVPSIKKGRSTPHQVQKHTGTRRPFCSPPLEGCKWKQVGLNFESLFSKPASPGFLPYVHGNVFVLLRNTSQTVSRGPAAVHSEKCCSREATSMVRSGFCRFSFFLIPKARMCLTSLATWPQGKPLCNGNRRIAIRGQSRVFQ